MTSICSYSFYAQSQSTPSIHVESVTPTILNPFINAELQELLQEVEILRRETDSFDCTCNHPDCPFRNTIKEQFDEESEKESPDLGFGSMEALDSRQENKSRFINLNRHAEKKVHYSMPPLQLESPPLSHRRPLGMSISASRSLTSIPRGVQKRADGTILECDYPGSHGRGRKHGLISGFSMSHLNRLDVSFSEAMEADCLVDQDGLTNNDNYMFNRKAPERRLRRNWRRERTVPIHHTSDSVLRISRPSSAETVSWQKKRLSTTSS